MEITIFDQIVLLLTGLTAVYLAFRFFQEYKEKEEKPRQNIHYIVAFIVLFVSGVLIIFMGFEILKNPLIAVVATILPFGIAMGLICEFYQKKAVTYLIILLIGLVAIALEQFGLFECKLIYPVFHTIAGLTIFFVPIMAVKNKKADKGFIWVTVGGTIIGIGGIALAFLGAGKPLLGIFTEEVVFTILTPILLLMALGFTYGFVKKIKNPVE
ncbi:MAG: hypothetical protein B6I20_11295 [Bacteroidetes bacterium 4572_117]|nr:MAG: hypothetical protein B6I20_11295 [Bacteroidetes bacterium 4572_117]